jgi:rhodanese-related sulfurtransferase
LPAAVQRVKEMQRTGDVTSAADQNYSEGDEVEIRKRELSPEEFREEVVNNGGEVVLIDVRTDREWDIGRIPGSVQMNINQPGFEERLSEYPRDKEIYFYCASGRRTQDAMRIAERLGFQNVSHLKGGVNSWNRNEFELKTD